MLEDDAVELIRELLVDIGLLICLLASTVAAALIVPTFWQGTFGFHSFSVRVMGDLFSSFPSFIFASLALITSFCPLPIISYVSVKIIYIFEFQFDILELILISTIFFVCMFWWISGGQIPSTLEEIDSSLTPSIVVTLLVTAGMLLA